MQIKMQADQFLHQKLLKTDQNVWFFFSYNYNNIRKFNIKILSKLLYVQHLIESIKFKPFLLVFVERHYGKCRKLQPGADEASHSVQK